MPSDLTVHRQLTRRARIGPVELGGGAPVVVQSMTNTDTSDVTATTQQCAALAQAGSELVRISVNTLEAALAVPRIRERLSVLGIHVPLVGDFHFNGHRLLQEVPDCAQSLAKYRINPGNVGQGKEQDARFSRIIEIACRYQKPVRIGVNWGSLDQALLTRLMDENAKARPKLSARQIMREAVITSALTSAQRAVALGQPQDAIILSCKMSNVQDLIAVYQELATRCDYPLHLGLTEAGMGSRGIVASSSALAILLQQGIGDTIRISLTPEPGGDRCQEVTVAQELLQVMGIRAFSPQVSACPGCGRTTSTVFQELAQKIQTHIKERMPQWRRKNPGVESLSVAVMGCVVNGPGESKHADIGISLPGTGEEPAAPVYMDGEHVTTLRGAQIADKFVALLEDYIDGRFGTVTLDNQVVAREHV